MGSNYLVWRDGLMQDGVCKLEGLANVEDDFQINDGVSRANGWPSDASAAMSPDFPKDLGLADSLGGAGFVVVSAKVKDFLDAKGVAKIEYLPIQIINHKGRPVPEPYFVINPLETVDCIDKDASGAKFNPLQKTKMKSCKQLVLHEDKIPDGARVFRPAFWGSRILIRRDLADQMTGAGLTCLSFIEPSAYTGLL